MNKLYKVRTGLAAVVATCAAAIVTAAIVPPDQADSAGAQIRPRYDGNGALLLPADYQQWVFVGASLGLSYSEGQRGAEMFHETLMEPTAYRHFVATGSFREGTMFALLLHSTGEGVLPGRRGRFAGELRAVEMAVKDTSHRAEGWAYYNFGGRDGLRPSAQAMPKASCHDCHAQHAKRDNVFVQFYPLLLQAAHLPTQAAETPNVPAAAPASESTLALAGLDPVLLVEGREEKGKPEIVASHGRYRYQFVSEPNRVRFVAEPQKFTIQNETCPVVAGAPIDPALFAVHAERIYAFASDDCVRQFKKQPGDFVK